jgi:outer membrane lipoprotein-sorting protein
LTLRRAAPPFAALRLSALGLIASSLAALCLACAASPARAADPVPAVGLSAPSAPPLSADDKALVQEAVDYLQSLKAAQGRFTQVDPKGRVSTGEFSMLRPGRARFQYDPPAALLVVADGANVAVYDRRLKTFDQYPLEQTPLKLLLGKTVRLDRGVVVTKVDRSGDGFAITARDARRPALGGITLRFSQAPLMLKGWTVLDAQGKTTEVMLKGFSRRADLPAGLFVLHDPTVHAAQP